MKDTMDRCVVKMTKTDKGSDRDHKGCALPVKDYECGQEYLVCRSLGEGFSSRGTGVIVDKPKAGKKKESAPVEKLDKPAPAKKKASKKKPKKVTKK